jgi:hypothetical protein
MNRNIKTTFHPNTKFELKLTNGQIDLITTALFEYSGVCEQDADLNDGVNINLIRLAKALDKCRHAVQLQANKQRVKKGIVQKLNRFKKAKGEK